MILLKTIKHPLEVDTIRLSTNYAYRLALNEKNEKHTHSLIKDFEANSEVACKRIGMEICLH